MITTEKLFGMITTDRLFGEKVRVPPNEYDIHNKRHELEEKYYVIIKNITATDMKERMEQIEAYVIEQGKEHAAWRRANYREASLIAFEGDRVLCRLGNKLEWFYLAEVELAGDKPLSG